MEYPDWSPPPANPMPNSGSGGAGWGQSVRGGQAPSTASGAWGGPSDEARQRAAAERYASADEPTPSYPGFHTYATNPELPADSGAKDDRWPDNWPEQRPDEESASAVESSDDEPRGRRDYQQPLLWTGFWLLLPLLGLLGQALFKSNEPVPGCVAGLAACESPRVEALGNLISNSPRWLLAIVAALAVATVLRWASDVWRAVTIGFCSAVVAGGAVTILASM